MKIARFADVVEASGPPETHVLWVPAAEDKVFQRALKEHRIMTLHQAVRGAKKDYGQVGVHEAPGAQFMIFPKSLRRFANRRIIGINYELMAKDSRPNSARVEAPRTRKVATSTKKRTPARADEENEKVIQFIPPAPLSEPKITERSKRAPAPRPVRLPKGKKHSSEVNRRAVAQAETALTELRAGKSAAAYQRLERLVREARSSARTDAPG